MASYERGPAQKRESAYSVAEEDVRWMLGDITNEEWESAVEALHELREQIGQMQWFSAGPNSVSAGKRLDQWTELAFAPADSEHESQIKEVLSRLKITPWEEMMGNVKVLIVENKRDVELLRSGLVFDYLSDQHARKEHERMLEEERARYAEQVRQHTEALLKLEAKEREAREKREEEVRWNLRIDMEGQEFRRLKQEERESRIAAVFASIPRTPKQAFEKPARLPQDQYYRFGYPNVPRTSSIKSKEGVATTIIANEEEPIDVDTYITQMEQDFAEGKMNEETLSEGYAAELRPDSLVPNLTLFPKKYEWVKEEGKRGFIRERASKEVISKETIENIVLSAQMMSKEGHDAAVRELSLMQRTLILYIIRKVQARNISANPDEMLQAALQGLTYAVDHYEKRDDSNFNTYMVPCIEGYIRRISTNAQFKAVRVPIHMSPERKKLFNAVHALQALNPDRQVETSDVAKLLHQEGVLKEPTMEAYDRYVRKVLYAYEQTGLESFDDESFSLSDVDMRGLDPYAEPQQSLDIEHQQLALAFDRTMMKLDPREERVVRKYFELHRKPGQISGNVFERVSRAVADEFPNITAAEVKERIRGLTGKGSLTDPEILESLNTADRKLVEAYRRILEDESADETLESIGNEYSVSRERIRQILTKALRRMKHPARSRDLLKAGDFAPKW